MSWSEVGLVIAGGAGPLLITIVNNRSNRRMEADRWQREDRDRTCEVRSCFIAAATQVLADWHDYVTVPPQTIDEERKLDERRDANYTELNRLSARVRLEAPADVVAEAEEMLAQVRAAQRAAKSLPAHRGPGEIPAEWTAIEFGFIAARDRFVSVARRRNFDPVEAAYAPA